MTPLGVRPGRTRPVKRRKWRKWRVSRGPAWFTKGAISCSLNIRTHNKNRADKDCTRKAHLWRGQGHSLNSWTLRSEFFRAPLKTVTSLNKGSGPFFQVMLSFGVFPPSFPCPFYLQLRSLLTVHLFTYGRETVSRKDQTQSPDRGNRKQKRANRFSTASRED